MVNTNDIYQHAIRELMSIDLYQDKKLIKMYLIKLRKIKKWQTFVQDKIINLS